MAEENRPRRPQDDWQREFSASLRKATEQLAVGAAHEASKWAVEFVEQAKEYGNDRKRRRFEEKIERERLKHVQRQERREAKLAATSPVEGYAFMGAAAMLVFMAWTHIWLFWLVFVALGLGSRGAQIIGYHHRQRALSAPRSRQKLPVPVPTSSERDSRAVRIDEICDRLKSALKDAPRVVHDFLSRPEETVDALRKTSHDLLKREISLRALVSADETERLSRERIGLQARIERETDDIVRVRLTGALHALDDQRRQYEEVLKSAKRLEAERTRLGYTLEGLYAQVMRVRTAEPGATDLVSEGLRTSLDQLRDEMGALADAVEQVNHAPVPAPYEPPAVFDSSTGVQARQKSIDKL